MRFLPFAKGKKGFQFAGGGVSDSGGGGGGSYVLPVASASTLGGVKVGEGLSITPGGVLSSSGGGGIDFSSNETKIGTFLGADLYSKVYSTVGTGGSTLQYKNADLSNKKIFYAFAVSRYDDSKRQYIGAFKDGSALGTANVSIQFTFTVSLASTTDVDIIVIYTKIS